MKKLAHATFAVLINAAWTVLIPVADASADCHEHGKARVSGVGPDATHAATHAAIADWKREVWEDCKVHAQWGTAHDGEIRCKHNGDDTKCKVKATPAL